MIIGLTGKNASGKGTVAEILRQRSFYYYSLSDVIREKVQEVGLFPSRENLFKMGNQLRLQYGPGILAETILGRLELNKNYVVDSFRSPYEVEVFRKAPNFTLISVEATEGIRFSRLKARSREGDPTTLEGFLEAEHRESENNDESQQQLLKTQRMADRTLVNDDSLEALGGKVNALLQEISNYFTRPSWDEYFMSIAGIVASRSNCVKRKVAAVIVKDQRIIATGYNGTPRGARNCNEGGCPRCNAFAEAGTRLEECLCCHGEENAITQAAYWGISVKGASVYCTLAPCLICTKMIINAGISEVIFNVEYHLNETAFHLFHETGVNVRQYKMGSVTK
ncbi:MAG: AAA family ATPase [Acidobacteria bacterium]|nr:AAA family ATPase [Acidobacteriota bacterium]